jgi:hypothetical protein
MARAVGEKLTVSQARKELKEGLISEAELRLTVARLVRRGNMPACRFYYETWLKPLKGVEDGSGDDALAEVDELARKRAERGA